MAVSSTYNPYFIGRVLQREYAQEFDFEYIPNYSTLTDSDTGEVIRQWIASYTRNFVAAKVVEQTFRFTGLTRALAFGTSAITVADLNNNEYTITPKTSITDGSSGSRTMIVEEVAVQRTPVSPRMWDLTVTRKGFRYFLNGTHLSLSDEPSWISSYV